MVETDGVVLYTGVLVLKGVEKEGRGRRIR
jgi:hypothetical protein